MTDSVISFQIGDKWMNGDCSMQLSCVVCASCQRPVGEISSQVAQCDAGANCVEVDDVSQCQDAGRRIAIVT